MQRRLSSLLFAVVLVLSFAATAGQASANPGNGAGSQTTTSSGGGLTTYGVTWE